jgi:N-acetylmuramoyl-L-alanine amidase
MPAFKKPLGLLFIAVVLAGLLFWARSAKPAPLPPEWQALEIYHETLTRDDFEKLLTTVFTTGDAWRDFVSLENNAALIQIGNTSEEGFFKLRFASSPQATRPTPRPWRSTREIPSPLLEKPLAGLKIAIDPGHIGGDWAKMEERWLSFGGGMPVIEGDMTLWVAQLLKPRLEALGAEVSLVRSDSMPVTSVRPEDFLKPSPDSSPQLADPSAMKTAERSFYRTAEIHARAKRVNLNLKPDLVLCLHFNAEPWGDPTQPTLIDRTHLHLILNGAYTDDELALPEQRLALVKKLLSRTHEEEVLVGSQLAATFAEFTQLPPYLYPADSKNSLPIPGEPYLWSRNLLANRLYDCPVIYMEPYVMNSTIDYPRLQAGDYEGLREINGKWQISIFQEYANGLVQGLVAHYSKPRP